ncbi:hypothetical protein OXYTRIMIC_584 [Oxytricha trifallax]|uniref:Uncharacterized protein n=1 Tax=Oxytricha trifallax TaxID=1172189 RepID=A0A073IBU1_9SPIT|nr:hypothetical protein OXYTRIMIC_584 [Oxytricha trifallax]
MDKSSIFQSLMRNQSVRSDLDDQEDQQNHPLEEHKEPVSTLGQLQQIAQTLYQALDSNVISNLINQNMGEQRSDEQSANQTKLLIEQMESLIQDSQQPLQSQIQVLEEKKQKVILANYEHISKNIIDEAKFVEIQSFEIRKIEKKLRILEKSKNQIMQLKES